MKTDRDVQRDVVAELEWDPSVDADHVGVSVTDGVVTLTGTVPSFAEKIAVEKASRRVTGVRAVVEAIKVRLPSDQSSGDGDIARRIIDTLDNNTSLSPGRIRVQVEQGAVTLSGSVDWRFQREQAQKSITHVHGITSIANLVEVHNPVCAADVADGVGAAFRRLAALDIAAIQVRTDGSTVILSGTVQSLHEADVARGAAWAAPGVTAVDDQLRVAG